MTGGAAREAMSITMLTRDYPPRMPGGGGAHVANLVATLRQQIAVDVHCFGEDRPDARGHDAPDALRRPAHVRALHIVASMTGGAEPRDLVHSHNWGTNLAGHMIKLRHAIPHVITSHSLEPLKTWKTDQHGHAVAAWMERAAYAGADRIIAVSRRLGEQLLEHYPEVDPAVVSVIPNGIDRGVYHPAAVDPDVLRSIGLDPSRKRVTFVGRVGYDKGIPSFVDAVRPLDPDVEIVMCTGVSDRDDIERVVHDAITGLSDARPHVVWKRDVYDKAVLRAVYASSSVVVVPSVVESFGLVAGEAMACGAAVVVSSAGGLPEVVDDGVGGIVVSRDDGEEAFVTQLTSTVERLLEDEALAKRLGAGAVERVRSVFDWQKVAAATIDVYRAALAAR